jgi:hypothetical protein
MLHIKLAVGRDATARLDDATPADTQHSRISSYCLTTPHALRARLLRHCVYAD